MTETTKVHALWMAAAVAAFAIGAQFPVTADRTGAPGTRAGKSDDTVAEIPTGLSPTDGDPSPDALDTAAKAVSRGLTDQQVTAIGEQFRTSNNPIEKRLAFSKLLGGLTAGNALLVREQIEHMDHHSAEFREFHYAWGAVAGADAAMFGIDTEKDDMMPALAGWANADPSAATRWFQTVDIANDPRFDPLTKDRKLDPDGLKSHLMRGLVQGLADTDPDAATAFIAAAAEGGDKAAYYGMMHMVVEARMRNESPADAAEWAVGIGDEGLRRQALDRVADHYARRDIGAAQEWARGLESLGQAGNVGAVAQVGGHLARRDPNKAMAWLGEFPSGAAQNAGMHRAMTEWTGRDPGAASRHLTEMPASPAKDAAIGGFSRRIVWDDPEAAVAWAGTIVSEEHRNEVLVGTGRAWLRKDVEGAKEWVAAAGLPSSVQQAILNPTEKRDDG